MKDCYFYWSGDDGVGEFIYVDHKARKYNDGEWDVILDAKKCYYTVNGDGSIRCIQDATTGKRYYPAEDCKEIIW